MSSRVYVACFMGQGGWLFSQPVFGIRGMLNDIPGVTAEVFRYVDLAPALARIKQFRAANYKIAGVGFSLGCSAVSYAQTVADFDLVICLAASKLAANYMINHKHTKRSVLWHGPDFLSSAVFLLDNPSSFDVMHETALPHLLIPASPTIRANIVDEVRRLT